MVKESNRDFTVYFTAEFNKCLDQIQAFFADQGEDVLKWWFIKEDNMINDIVICYKIFPEKTPRACPKIGKNYVYR